MTGIDAAQLSDIACTFLTAQVHEDLAAAGLAVEVEAANLVAPTLVVSVEGHRFRIRVTYAGPLSIEQLAAIAARHGVTLTKEN